MLTLNMHCNTPKPWTAFCYACMSEICDDLSLLVCVQVSLIEKVKTDRTDKPLEDIKIMNIDVLDTVADG